MKKKGNSLGQREARRTVWGAPGIHGWRLRATGERRGRFPGKKFRSQLLKKAEEVFNAGEVEETPSDVRDARPVKHTFPAIGHPHSIVVQIQSSLFPLTGSESGKRLVNIPDARKEFFSGFCEGRRSGCIQRRFFGGRPRGSGFEGM